MIAARWAIAARPDASLTTALAADLAIPEALAALLVQRGHAAPELARAFLRPDLDSLSDPRAWAGMARATQLVAAAVRAGTPILVHGDYDVDGQCAAALLTRVLRAAGAQAHGFVPHRLRDGYDFGAAGLAEAQRLGAGLIITCDCGIGAVDAVRAARDAGREVIVTDHHLPGDVLPPASAVLDPLRADCGSTDKALCGAGVAFKLVQALVGELGLSPNLPLHFLDYVALATVADVVPLVGENRILVRHGLGPWSTRRGSPGSRSGPVTWDSSWRPGSTPRAASGTRWTGCACCSPTTPTRRRGWRGTWKRSMPAVRPWISASWTKR